MTASPVNPRRSAHPVEWVFRWRPLGSPMVPKLIALAVAGTAFTVLVTTVRIRLVLPEKLSPRKASLIFLGDDAQSRALALRAREGGPFPARFDPADWEGLAKVEQEVMDAARFQPPPYVPVMDDLPEENLVQPLVLAPRGMAFFPKRKTTATDAPDASKLRIAPAIYPLSAAAAATLPDEFPSFEGAVDSSASWRFIVCLNAEGGVTECVSLEKGAEGDLAADALRKWLHRVKFKPARGKPDRWIALGIGFTNQTSDGTDAR